MSEVWNAPKKIELLYEKKSSGTFSSINRPTSGSRVDEKMPRGDADVQLYSLGTPNGQKVSLLFEELIEQNLEFSYDAHFINIGEGDQFKSGFVDINPNSRIPSCVDTKASGGKELKLFESGSICLYFGEKYNTLIPKDPNLKATMMNWIFWQMGSQGPMLGQFGHFYSYAPEHELEARDYGVMRYGMETQRLCDVLDKHLSGKKYILGNEFSLADIMLYPWFNTVLNYYTDPSGQKSSEFLSVERYKNATAWAERLMKRPAFQRGMRVCSWLEFEEKGTKPWLRD